ncbi:MAG: hypothetical protein JWM83_565 [Candidatus Angelobacter sp.]|jgi:hypothetical protein|nr:hypothetical protein [Candidatus Angelobacter sp.]
MRKAGLISFLFFVAATLSLGQNEPKNEPKRAPSTKEERQRFLTLTRKLEQSPLDKSLYAEKTWAKKWLEDIPDINVNICAPILFGLDFVTEQNKYTPQLSYQATFGSAAYIIEHPDKAGDTDAQFVAGVESALKSYSAIVKSDPEAKSKSLDALLEKQKQGKLADFVRSASKGCEEKKEGT